MDDEAQAQLDTDILILEYLVYNATRSILDVHQEGLGPGSGSSMRMDQVLDNHTEMVDSFLQVFRGSHPEYETAPLISFRLRLLQFVTLLSQCRAAGSPTPSISTLAQLRADNRGRALRWQQEMASAETVSEGRLIQPLNADKTQSGLQNYTPTIEDKIETVTLLDLLPVFIELTRARATLASTSLDEQGHESGDEIEDEDEGNDEGEEGMWDTSPQWLSLAGEMMRQAAAERWSSHNRSREADDPAAKAAEEEAFSWGPLLHGNEHSRDSEGDTSMQFEVTPEETVEARRLNAIFLLPDEEPLEAEWWNIRQQKLSECRKEYGRREFEQTLCSFLGHLLDSLALPVLKQLEDDGMVAIDGIEVSDSEAQNLRRLARAR